MKKEGQCKLTLEYGRFIKSHLIPQALTRPEVRGGIMKQIGEGSIPKKATSSWYDYELVIRQGEDILTEFDTAAIQILRNNQLIWGGWELEFNSEHSTFYKIDDHSGVREFSNLDWKSLRLFALSLLWRACNTTQKCFSEISIPKKDLEKIRLLLINRDVGAIHFYPIKLCQLSTKGKIHNQTPFIRKFDLPKRCEVTRSRHLNIVRFYFDGLVMHIHLSKTLKQIENFDCQILGFDPQSLIVPTVTYETSFQRENLENIVDSYR
ncbi:hypothetical protein [Acinetobacter soli]|uniref:hypothetical protein n=1 Tax=Acinetobacter soli TaxID=487316 RepID=UPI00124C076F|nr:hypothetical protein [Acinetobacter soli]MDQ8942885.1 hypothetical protein [Acinetobacter soli]